MKFLIDFFPILLFFIAYKMGGIYTATAILNGISYSASDPLEWSANIIRGEAVGGVGVVGDVRVHDGHRWDP